MPYHRPIVLSIAGFDPCGGAGILADIKTIEQHKCLGMSISTANTLQTEDHFYSLQWNELSQIIYSIEKLFIQYPINYIKIGIVPSLYYLEEIVNYIKSINPNSTIVWDPVLTATSGATFLERADNITLESTLTHIDIITPNIPEAISLSNKKEIDEAGFYLSQFCTVLIKGGHHSSSPGLDTLFVKSESKPHLIFPGEKNISGKHGSGCIYSSSLTCNLALGENIESACMKSKEYIEKILTSNSHKLAYHVA